MTVTDALKIEQNWTVEQARNDIEKYLLRDELPAYKAVALAIVALEKQIPKKAILDAVFPSGVKWFNCPECGCKRLVIECAYCPDCGQALDWGKKE